MKQILRYALEYVAFVAIVNIVIFSRIMYVYGTLDVLPNPTLIVIIIGFVCGVLIILMRLLLKYLRDRRYLKSPLSKIDKMTGEEFEEYLRVFFENSGYKVEKTPASNDYGADLICTNKKETIVVQAKRYEANVGNAAVQEVVAAKDYYEADRCIVVTNSYFTKNAIGLANANDVELWDRDEVSKRIWSK